MAGHRRCRQSDSVSPCHDVVVDSSTVTRLRQQGLQTFPGTEELSGWPGSSWALFGRAAGDCFMKADYRTAVVVVLLGNRNHLSAGHLYCVGALEVNGFGSAIPKVYYSH